MSKSSGSWSISVKTVGGSESVKAAKASSNDIQKSASGSHKNNHNAHPQVKDPPINLKSTVMEVSLKEGVIEEAPSNFTIEVEASDEISILHDKIEQVTGLKASQQRLIYRGRLLSKESTIHTRNKNSQLQDIEGLCDGQTIHLVPRPLPPDQKTNANSSTTSSSDDSNTSSNDRHQTSIHSSNNNNNNNNNNNTSATASATNLLATLLGLSVPTGQGNDDNEETDLLTNVQERRRQIRSLSQNSTRQMVSTRRSGRSNSYSTPINDSVWERNPLEPVRQGLLTLHTLLEGPNSQSSLAPPLPRPSPYASAAVASLHGGGCTDNNNTNNTNSTNHDHDHNHEEHKPPKWYRGQWLDVKDTVDQWLEATIVEVFDYKDIFTPDQIQEYDANAQLSLVHDSNSKPSANDTTTATATDASTKKKKDDIVGSNNIEGRKTLFLEEVPDQVDESGKPLMKFRKHVERTQLILVHYNGWPHRWDEWIRGDSDRIRIFRTKTRHASSAPFTTPTPNSLYVAAPTTYIYEDGENDRAAILPELERAFCQVQKLLTAAIPPSARLTLNDVTSNSIVPPSNTFNNDNTHGSLEGSNDLPWRSTPSYTSPEIVTPPNLSGTSTIRDDTDDVKSSSQGKNDDVDEDSKVEASPSLPSTNLPWHESLDRETLGNLAPLIDRLGRTLTDAAPHIAALATSLPTREELEWRRHQQQELSSPSLLQSPPDFTDSKEAIKDLYELDDNDDDDDEDNEAPTRRHFLPNVRLTHSDASTSTETRSCRSVPPPPTPRSQPVDYTHTLVNTTRDENPSRRSRHSSSHSSSQESPSSFLGTYLAARGITEDDRGGSSGDSGPTLARFLRVGGGSNGSDNGGGSSTGTATGNGNGGGIDIHIHAIVTPVAGAGGRGVDVGMGFADGNAFPFVGLQPIAQEVNSVDADLGGDSGMLRNGSSPILNTWSLPEEEEEDMALFSDLYTESPPPFEFPTNEGEEGEPEERSSRQQEDENNNVDDGNNDESTPQVVAYSVAVGDIPGFLPDESNIMYTQIANAVSVDEENRLSEGSSNSNANDIVNTANEVATPLRAQSSSGSNVDHHMESSLASSSSSSSRGQRRNRSTIGRLIRAFRRRPSSDASHSFDSR